VMKACKSEGRPRGPWAPRGKFQAKSKIPQSRERKANRKELSK
jgi:hypothetical protein